MKKLNYVFSTMILLSLVLVACGGATSPTTAPENTSAPEATEASAPAALAYPAGQELTDAYTGTYSGTVVTIVARTIRQNT